jgi:ABC-type multidrug transport system fused ATPase/permease subunit
MAEATISSPDTQAQTAENENTQSWWTFQRIVIAAVAAFIGIYVLLFLIGFVSALIWNEGAAAFFRYFRDLITIGLALSSMMVFVGIGILIAQVARFVNLLRSEVKPLGEDAKQALRNVRVTSEFVQKHAVEPIIRIQAFLAGIIAFLREIVLITQLLQRRDNVKKRGEQDESDDSSYSS